MELPVRAYLQGVAERYDVTVAIIGHSNKGTPTEVEVGKLAGDFLLILDHLREWDEGGVWVLAYAR